MTALRLPWVWCGKRGQAKLAGMCGDVAVNFSGIEW